MRGTVLIANRGEIACRIIRTARELGLRTVAVHSEADATAPHVAMADQAVEIGEAAPAASYLNGARIIDVAQQTGATMIHPGYGFLSENAGFAEAVADAGLVFVGPPAEAIRLMGDKAVAKRRMIEAGVPCVPGFQDDGADDSALIEAAGDIGFPVMVKAAAGGGGRGMRLVGDPADLPGALATARSEAENAFGSGALILEKAIRDPRHVEIQVFADGHGTVIHMGERDCSAQRRHQKVLEEAPCPVMTPALRAEMGAAAVEAARAVGYVGAGTVEFLLDADGGFYFLEMNTRLQVEHPVTEMVTGLDLVALQFQVASGAPLGLAQAEIAMDGHAIEARLYAEDPGRDFLPSAGMIEAFEPAAGPGLRVDAGIAAGQEISPFYDPMIAKLIAHGPTREIARQRLVDALERTVIFGPETNRRFLIDLLASPDFVAGATTTGLIGAAFTPDDLVATPPDAEQRAMAAALAVLCDRGATHAASIGVPQVLLNWSSGAPVWVERTLTTGGEDHLLAVLPAPGERFTVREGEVETAVTVHEFAPPRAEMEVAGRRRHLHLWHGADGRLKMAEGGRSFEFTERRVGHGAGAEGADAGRITAPMHGVLAALTARVGAVVQPGDQLGILEAMKMQHPIEAEAAGTVTALHASEGQQVAGGALLIEIDIDG